MSILLGSYTLLTQKNRSVKEGTQLNEVLVAVAVETYLTVRKALCGEHKIPGRIQRHKIAGLMAGAILKAKPIQLNVTRDRLLFDNEMLAAYHGLAVCAENEHGRLQTLTSTEHFHTWLSDLIHLFTHHPTHTESFILIFETLSLTYFPNNLSSVDD